MGSAGYVFERFVMLTYFVYIFWHALKNPKNYSFLTFWTLVLHVLYFSIDKASPVAGAAEACVEVARQYTRQVQLSEASSQQARTAPESAAKQDESSAAERTDDNQRNA